MYRILKTAVILFFVGSVGGGCASFSRVLDGPVLVVGTPFLSYYEEQIIAKRGVGLFRLVPANEVQPVKHRAALWQNGANLVGLVVEKSPIAYGSYSGRKIQFILPGDFEPSTHCFVVVAASGYVVATSIGSADKRYLVGLHPYSKNYLSEKGREPSSDVTRTSKVYSGADLECGGVVDDYINNQVGSVGW